MALRRLEPLLAALAALVAGLVCVQLAYRVHPIAPIALMGAAGGVWLAFWRPVWSLYCAILLIPLELVSFRVGAAGLSPAEGVFLLTGAAWAARRLAFGQLPWVSTPLTAPLAILVLAVIPGVATAVDSFAVWKVVVLWSAFFFIFQMIVAEGDDDSVRQLLYVLAISGGIVGLIAISGTAGQQPELVGAGDVARGRARAAFGHPNTLATFLALALPGALALGLTGRLSLRPVAFGAFAAMLIGISLSLSRGGLLAIAGALGLMLLWRPARRAAVLAIVGAALLYAAGAQPLGASQQIETVTQRLNTVSYSASGVDPRFYVWERTPQVVAESLPFGVGANNFAEVAPRYGLLLGTAADAWYEHAHNIPLTFLAELGIAGFVASIWLAVALVSVLTRAYRRSDTARRGLVIAVAAALFALALQGMVDYTLRSGVLVALIFALAGCAVVLARGGADDAQERATAR
jgi:O-antigen ligase